MARYESLPVEVEAHKWDPDERPTNAPDWLWKHLAQHPDMEADGSVHIHTLEGVMKAKPGDYIIRGTEGELYPCKPSVFERKYRLIDR